MIKPLDRAAPQGTAVRGASDTTPPNRVDSTRTKAELIGIGVGFTAAHEGGHFFGLHHTHHDNDVPNIMDEGGGSLSLSYDIGLDGVFGPGDGDGVRFREDVFQAYYPFSGVQQTPSALALSLGNPPPDDRVTDPEGIAAATTSFSAYARRVALASGSVRALYGSAGAPPAGPTVWTVPMTEQGGSVSTSDGRTVEVTSGPGQRMRAWPRGMLPVTGGLLARASVRRLPGSSACASPGFFTALWGGEREAYVLVDAGAADNTRWAHLAGAGWVPQAVPVPSSTAFTLELAVHDGVGRLFVDGTPVPTADGSVEFAVDQKAGYAGLTVNGCGETLGRFSFSNMEVLALGERTPVKTPGGTGGIRQIAAPGDDSSVRAAAPPQTLPTAGPAPRGIRGMRGPVGIAPTFAGPAGFVYTFRQGPDVWRVRLAEGGDVWVQPPGSETWREARPGEVSSLLGTAEAATVVTETALSEAEAAAALDGLRRASEE